MKGEKSYIYSCEDAAQQVPMSSVCLSVCLSSMLKFFHSVQHQQLAFLAAKTQLNKS